MTTFPIPAKHGYRRVGCSPTGSFMREKFASLAVKFRNAGTRCRNERIGICFRICDVWPCHAVSRMTGHPCGSALLKSSRRRDLSVGGFCGAAFRAFDPFLVVFRYGHLQHELFLARLALVRVVGMASSSGRRSAQRLLCQLTWWHNAMLSPNLASYESTCKYGKTS